MPLYGFSCSCGWAAQLLRPFSAKTEECPRCGSTVGRDPVNRINFGGFVSTPVGQADFRDDYRRFDEATSELAYKKERYEDSAQVKSDDPPLYSAGKAKAKQLDRAGVSTDVIKT